jgi:hypothetical protein
MRNTKDEILFDFPGNCSCVAGEQISAHAVVRELRVLLIN